MNSCCFLSTDNLEGYTIDDDHAMKPLNALGWEIETVSWHEQRDWNQFDIVVIRTTWDYHRSPDEFLEVLAEIDNSSAHLENALELVRWNLEKTYLKDLVAEGVITVPTLFGTDSITDNLVAKWKSNFGAKRLVIKPTISATAQNTYLVHSIGEELKIFDEVPYMVQPLMKRILTEGEYSLFFFDGEFSHGILKTPMEGDFRVQEDFGGMNTAVTPHDDLLACGRKVLDAVDQIPLYARVDCVRNESGEFALMELELIEPALYFRYDKAAPKRFAKKLVRRMNEL